MTTNGLYAFYGSLRRGMENYLHYQDGLEYLYSLRLQGFRVYSLGPYPAAVKTGNQSHSMVVEVFRISKREVAQSIHELEINAGYYFDTLTIAGEQVGIYLFKSCENYREVSSGDWVRFFRKNAQL